MHAHCSSGGCGNHAPWPCPCPPSGNARLTDAAQLVACFQQTQGSLAAEGAFYSELTTAPDALREAILALADDIGLRPMHSALSIAVVNRLTGLLLPEATALASCTDFAELHGRLLHHGAPAGLTPLGAYDIALRFGMHTGLEPERIFIHDGNRDSSVTLHLTPPDGSWLEKTELPLALQNLTAAEAELCLSLCTCQWQWLAAADASPET